MDLARILVTKAWGWLVLGFLFAAAGALMAWQGTHDKAPEFAQLTKVEGKVLGVMKIEHKSKKGEVTGTDFEIEIAPAKGEPVKLTLQVTKIKEQQAGRLSGRHVVAYYRDSETANIWEFAADGVKLIDFNASRNKYIEDLAWSADYGPYIAAGGVLLFFLGGIRLFRSWRKPAVAA
jgi:hypothetical protein